jgi:FKBP-type peptidyl-prolyl cis-trans isomerase
MVRVPPSAFLVALLALSAVTAACSDSPTSPSTPFSLTELRLGSGAEASAGHVVTVHYTGWLFDASKPDQKGLQFTSSISATPFTFTLGAGQVIQGWDQGLVGMKVGGLRRLVIPPSLGYGAGRTEAIPPNATLVFEVELLEID